MRRIGLKYRIAFVAATLLVVAGWGFVRYRHYRYEQTEKEWINDIEENLRVKGLPKDGAQAILDNFKSAHIF